MTCSVTNPLDCVSGAAKSVAGDAFSAIAKDFAQAGDSTINWLWTQLGQASAVQLGGKGFETDLAIVAAITGVVAVALFVIQLATAVLRRDPGGISRAVKGLFVAFIAGGAAVGVTNLALQAVDSLSAGVVQAAMGTSLDQMGHKLLADNALLAVQNPAGELLLAVAAIVAAVTVWVALVIRKVLIVVSAVFAPLAFAGSLADITAGWTRRWIETMIALVFSKLILVLIVVVGWGMLDAGVGQAGNSNAQQITQTAAGLIVLAVAGFAPWMALKLVHFGEEHFHRIHSLGGTAASGARSAVAAPQKAAAWKATAAGFGAKAATGAAKGGGTGGGGSGPKLAAAASTPGGGGKNGPGPSGQPGGGLKPTGPKPTQPAGAKQPSGPPAPTPAPAKVAGPEPVTVPPMPQGGDSNGSN